jgi:hypothetical protein
MSNDRPKTLADVLPPQFLGGEYANTEAYKYRDEVVVERHEYNAVTGVDTSKPWPGPHKNVVAWYVLANGKMVGFNENVSRGWSFPVMRARPGRD